MVNYIQLEDIKKNIQKVFMCKKKLNLFCIAGTNSGVGKTVITLAIIRAFINRGLPVQPFKCGPDYIDSEYLSRSARRDSYNLDTWMMGEKEVANTFYRKMQNADIGIVEGVMGLFDGTETESLKGSTASVANLLNIPIILVVNAKGLAQSIAAIVKGYHTLYEKINIAGVIANNVGSKEHKKILEETLKKHNLPPLIGILPKNKAFELSERHLGLTPDFETEKQEEWFNEIAEIVAENIDLNRLLKISETVKSNFNETKEKYFDNKLRLGIAYDEAFHFYYRDNLDLFEKHGFKLIKFSPLNDKKLSDNIDCLYFGGGFPEMFVEKLSANKSMINSVKKFAENDGVIFAECGGYMYLIENFINDSKHVFSMCGLLKGNAVMTNSLQNFGYKEVLLDKNCIFGEKGTEIKGHEFHWSKINFANLENNLFLVKGPRAENWNKSGQIYKNVFGSYIHLHFSSNQKIVKNIRTFMKNKEQSKL